MVHPQAWPENLDYHGKRVVVIGSGATAVSVVPAMATDALHVTMLQRSPTYMAAGPDRDALANLLRKVLPDLEHQTLAGDAAQPLTTQRIERVIVRQADKRSVTDPTRQALASTSLPSTDQRKLSH